MRGIYFSQIRTEASYQGTVAKVFDEIKAFENAGFEMRHVNFSPSETGFRRFHIGKGICAAIPFTFIFSKYEYDSSFDGYDFFYFRFEAADRYLVKLLKQLKEHNPGSKIIIEFPDYPNTTWMKLPVYLPLLLKDIAARGHYEQYVDRFAVLNPVYKEIYGVKTIPYMNGIDVSRIPTRKPSTDTGKDSINIIGISTMFPVHGYDRVIRSLAEYYSKGNNRSIVIHIVGDGPGPELDSYKALVRELNLSERVVFEGRLVGEELYTLYDRCDLALEVFAAFRKGLETSSSLKSREYLSVGIPIITACNIDILENQDFRYLLRFENNDSMVDFGKIVSFFDDIYSKESRKDVIENIRSFAEVHCSYDHTLRKVIEYIRFWEGNGQT